MSVLHRMCFRKKKYRSREAAYRKAAHIERQRGMVLRIYECPVCRGFHLTSQFRIDAALSASDGGGGRDE